MCTRGLHIELPAVLRLLFKQYMGKKQQENSREAGAAERGSAEEGPSEIERSKNDFIVCQK